MAGSEQGRELAHNGAAELVRIEYLYRPQAVAPDVVPDTDGRKLHLALLSNRPAT